MEDILLGPPIERLEVGYQLVFSVVYFARGTESPNQKSKRAPSWGT